jgi:hypothetical protein
MYIFYKLSLNTIFWYYSFHTNLTNLTPTETQRSAALFLCGFPMSLVSFEPVAPWHHTWKDKTSVTPTTLGCFWSKRSILWGRETDGFTSQAVRILLNLQPVRSVYQPPASSTFLSERISHQQPAATSQQYSSFRTNQHQPSATSQPDGRHQDGPRVQNIGQE